MQNLQQDVNADLNKYTVKIMTDSRVGTGIIVTPISSQVPMTAVGNKENGLILTCYHVIGDVNSETLYDELKVYFPETKTTLSAQVISEFCNPKYDIAFLYIKETGKIPENLKVAPLSKEKVIYLHRFSTLGFRKSRQYGKLDATGDIRIETECT